MRTILMAAAQLLMRNGQEVPENPDPPAEQERLVAVGGNVIRIFDNIGYVDHVPDETIVWNDVVVANNKVVAVSYDNAKIAWMDFVNGIWNVVSQGTTPWRAVACIGEVFYFFGAGSTALTKLLFTTDFVNWGNISLSESASQDDYFKMSTHMNKLLVPVRSTSRVKSFDTPSNTPTNHSMGWGSSLSYFPVAFKVVNGMAFALGQGRRISAVAVNDSTIPSSIPYRDGSPGSSNYLHDIEYLPSIGKYVAVGTSGSSRFGNSPILTSSSDGITWSLDSTIGDKVGVNNPIQTIQEYKGSLYMGTNDGKIFKTSDLVNFEVVQTLPGRVFNLKKFQQ